jgi:hypothetical protein
MEVAVLNLSLSLELLLALLVPQSILRHVLVGHALHLLTLLLLRAHLLLSNW